MKKRPIALHIGHLVVDGYSQADAARLRQSLVKEMEKQLATRDAGSFHSVSTSGKRVAATSGDAAAIGREAAQGIVKSLKPGKAR